MKAHGVMQLSEAPTNYTSEDGTQTVELVLLDEIAQGFWQTVRAYYYGLEAFAWFKKTGEGLGQGDLVHVYLKKLFVVQQGEKMVVAGFVEKLEAHDAAA